MKPKKCFRRVPAAGLAVAAVLGLIWVAAGIRRSGGPVAGSPLPYHHTFLLANVIPVEIKIYTPVRNKESVFRACEKEAARCAKIFSKYDNKSELSGINRRAPFEHVTISRDMVEVLRCAFETNAATHGAFDITVFPLVSVWKEAKKRNIAPSKSELRRITQEIGMKNITFDDAAGKVLFQGPKIRIDLGGVSKGYIVDRLAGVLKKAGVKRGLVNMGGDMCLFGGSASDPFLIGVQHPRDKTSLIGKMKIEEGAVATSGDYERYTVINGKKYSHIIDPRTGMPVSRSPSVTIVATDATTADALATGISVLGADAGVRVIGNIDGVECLVVRLIDGDADFVMSRGMKDLFLPSK